jgi:hypothetical protein
MSNPDAVSYGVITTILAGVASGIGSFSIISGFLAPIAFLIGAAINTGILHLVAKLFGGQGSYRDFFAVVTNAQVLLWIPFIGPFLLTPLIGLFLIAFTIFAIKTVYELSVARSIFAFFLPTIILGVLALIAALIFGTILASMLSFGALAAGA